MNLHSAELDSLLANQRIIDVYSCGEPGPLVLAIGGIHGNEPSGVLAIESVLRQLQEKTPALTGCVVGMLGNLPALADRRRCIDEDLNRCFKPERLNAPLHDNPTSEMHQLKDITQIIDGLASEYEDICFVDCHTTSSMSVPYISVNDHAQSLHLASHFPLSSVIGLEKSIPGCFGEYCNNRDFRGFTVEGGQHDELASIENHEAILWLLLAYSGAMAKSDIRHFERLRASLARTTTHGRKHYRLLTHYRIAGGEEFQMLPGFVSFQQVSEGELLAHNRFGEIRSPHDARILMPLYQKEGNDGFFLLAEY